MKTQRGHYCTTMKNDRKKKLCLYCAVIAITLLGTCCCRSAEAEWHVPNAVNPRKHWPFKKSDEPELGEPVRVVAAWVDTTMSKQGQKPQRGFGGRLTFYGEDESKPILVEGQLVVYAFDETGRTPTDNRPTRRYVFPAEQMALHMSKSKLGASYSFWLPWDEVGGRQTEISLISRFEPKEGHVVCSEQTHHLLPGVIVPEAALVKQGPPKLPEGVPSRPARPDVLREQAEEANALRLASYESTAVAPATPQHMTTTSIALPENFRVRGNTPSVRAGALPPEVPKRPSMPVIQQQPAIQQVVPPNTPTRSTSMTNYTPTIRAGSMPMAPAQQMATAGAGWGLPNQQQLASQQPMVQPIAPTQTAPTQNASIPGNFPTSGQETSLLQHVQAQQQLLQQVQQQQQPVSQQAVDPNNPTTTVSYLSPVDSIRWEQGQRSLGSAPPALPAQAR